jgi:hypothetical protein
VLNAPCGDGLCAAGRRALGNTLKVEREARTRLSRTLPSAHTGARRIGRLRFQRAMKTFLSTVLLRLAGLDALDALNAESKIR